MKKLLLTTACQLLLVGACLLATPVVAAEPASPIGCYGRVYDSAYTSKHPDQLVTAARLSIKKAPRSSDWSWNFSLDVTVRGKDLHTNGGCDSTREPGSLRCYVKPDQQPGGGGRLIMSPRPGQIMLIYVDDQPISMDNQQLLLSKKDDVLRLEGAGCRE
jgi:hypothetical protein